MAFKINKLNRLSLLILVCFLSSSLSLFAQELNCTVSVNYQKVQATDKSIFESLEAGITEFINSRKWTDDNFTLEERIECKFLIILDSRSDNNFSGSIQVSASRPVFGTNYKTTLFNVNDNSLSFTYNDQQALNFSPSEYQYELTSVLAFYAYMILGMDYDSFSLEGGKPYYQKAFEVLSLAQSASGGDGWQTTNSESNRYMLVESVTNTIFQPFRTCVYNYHRLGLDRMKDQKEEAYTAVLNGLSELEKVHKVRPSSYLLQVFFLGKYSEIVTMFEKRSPVEKERVAKLMIKLDPGNAKYYNQLLE